MLKGKYHRNEIRFTNIVDLDYVTCLEKKRKNKVATKMKMRKRKSSHPLSNKGEKLLSIPPWCYSIAHFSVNKLKYSDGWQDKVVVQHIIPLFPKMIDDALSR